MQTLLLITILCVAAAVIGEGWVSGFATVPKTCDGLSLRACTRCLHSKQPTNCLKCAKNPTLKGGLLEAVLADPYYLFRADGCGSCYNSTSPEVCDGCLNSKAPCAECALQPRHRDGLVNGDVGACVNCTLRHGGEFVPACLQCSDVAAGSMNQRQCFGCLDSMALSSCKPGTAGCWHPEREASACHACATKAHNHTVCQACLQRTPYSFMCSSCTYFGDSRQERCFQCIAETGRNECADCLWGKDAAQQEQCLACLADPARSSRGKGYCSSCMDWCDTKESRAQCMQCLTDTPEDASREQWYKCSCDPNATPKSGMAHAAAAPDDDW